MSLYGTKPVIFPRDFIQLMNKTFFDVSISIFVTISSISYNMPNKEGITKRLLVLARQLHNEFKVPVIVGIYSKEGILSYGSKTLVNKLNESLKDENEDDQDSWIKAFHLDQEEMINGERLNDEMDPFFQAQGNNLPDKLPASMDLMVFKEIHPIVSREILKWHWRQGGKFKTVHYGDPEFKADFWPESWPWETITKHFSNLKKTDYQGPEELNMTEFFRMVLKQIFENHYRINPANYVSKDFTEKKKRNRERYRGIHNHNNLPNVEPHVVIEEVESIGNNNDMNEEVNHGADNNQDEESIDMDFEDRAPEYNRHAMNDRQENDVGNLNEAMETLSRNEEQNDSYNSNLSDVIGAELYDQIEEALGPLSEEITADDIVSTPSPSLSRKRIRTENETLASRTDTSRVLRKTPAELNRNIPCKEPRIRLEVSNQASPIRNVGNCSTPQRANRQTRPTRNPSQNVAPGIDDALDNLENISIITDVVEAFKEISAPNTSSNPQKETGGLLFGRKVENNYVIDTLLIPKQNGYSDYFETTNEYEIHNFVNSDPDLILLGIIHTHPGFDAFLSSVDLHMLHRYIRENPSVISIVLAPEKNYFPAFSLTKTGLSYLDQCQRDIRRPHRHNSSGLYRLARHLRYINTGHIQIEDQR